MVGRVLKLMGLLWSRSMKLFTALVLVTASLIFSTEAQQQQKPLFLSYEQRLILSYLMAGAGESSDKQMEIAERFEKAFNEFLRMPVQTVTVSNFAEFLKAYQGEWPNSYSLESDLQLLEKGQMRGPTVIRGATPQIQSQIDGFIRNQNKTISEGAMNGVFNQKLAKITQMIDALIAQYQSGQELDLTNKKPYVEAGFRVAHELLQSHLEVIQKTGEDIAKSGKMTSQDAALSMFMETIFKEYFGRLGLASKKQIISQFLGTNLNSTTAQKFEVMVMNSGPQFQKLLQVVARDAGISEDLLATFKRLESKANPIPAAIVRDLFEAERDRYQWLGYRDTPLGTGTMAQVHQGVIRNWAGEKTRVVIRFLKPEIEKRIAEDNRILMEIAPLMDNDARFKAAGYPKLEPVVSDLNKTILDELDLEATKGRQRKGKEIYTRDLFFKSPIYRNSIELSVPGIYDGVPMAGFSKLMVQDMVPGTKLDKEANKYAEVAPDFKRILIEEISRVWLDEVLFKSGFFHSDLHQGNFMVELTEPAIKVSILDFGMGGTIRREMQLDLLLLGAGLELNKANVIVETLWSLSEKDQNKISREDFEKSVLERVAQINSGKLAWQPLNSWTTWAMDSGLRFPYEFVSLNRGMAILDKSLSDAGSKLNSAIMAKQLASKSFKVLFSDLRAKGLLSWKDLAKLGWLSINPPAVVVPAGAQSADALLGGRRKCSQIHQKALSGNLFLIESLLSY